MAEQYEEPIKRLKCFEGFRNEITTRTPRGE